MNKANEIVTLSKLLHNKTRIGRRSRVNALKGISRGCKSRPLNLNKVIRNTVDYLQLRCMSVPTLLLDLNNVRIPSNDPRCDDILECVYQTLNRCR